MRLLKRLKLACIVVVSYEQPRRRGTGRLGQPTVDLPGSPGRLRRRTAADEVRDGRAASRQPLPRELVGARGVERAGDMVRVKRHETSTVHHHHRPTRYVTSGYGLADQEGRQLVGGDRVDARRRPEMLRRRRRPTTSGSTVSASGIGRTARIGDPRRNR